MGCMTQPTPLKDNQVKGQSHQAQITKR